MFGWFVLFEEEKMSTIEKIKSYCEILGGKLATDVIIMFIIVYCVVTLREQVSLLFTKVVLDIFLFLFVISKMFLILEEAGGFERKK